MQTDHNANDGRGASVVSRRKFFQMAAAGSAAALPGAASAAAASKSPRLSPNEATLVDLINKHSLISSRLKLAEKSCEAIESRPDRPPHLGIKLRGCVERQMDYPPAHLEERFFRKEQVDSYFEKKYGNGTSSPFSSAYFERVKRDWTRAAQRCDAIFKAHHRWNEETGVLDLIEEIDNLYAEKDGLEETVCKLPCTSPRMAAIKAKFAAENIADRIPSDYGSTQSVVDVDAMLLVSMLKSMLPLMEEP